jgi:hypothetical protein
MVRIDFDKSSDDFEEMSYRIIANTYIIHRFNHFLNTPF